MNWSAKPHPIERIAEGAAPAILAAASAWAAMVAQLPLEAIAAAGGLALILGLFAMRFAGHSSLAAVPAFAPAEYECDDLLGELLLDDPLESPEPGSRVVRLFERQDPTPGELVLRISDFLVDNGRPVPEAVEAEVVGHQPVDASAALHEALANIRASLR
jgi:hypothetical protein